MAQIFPRWANSTPRLITIGSLVGTAVAVFGVYWWASPYHTDVGYRPQQPVPYSHKLHVGELGMDCRYCHAYVERGPFAGVPPTQVCMNCHRQVKADSTKLAALRDSWSDGKDGGPVHWKRVHKVPDFAYFNHSAHVGVGTGADRAAIGCESCHGRIDTMAVVRQEKPLSMQWCIECHSDPAPNLRPVSALTQMGWTPDLAWMERAKAIAATLHPPGSISRAQVMTADGSYVTYATAGCSGCHR